MDDYKRGGHSKYSMKAHIIFVTKYRKKIFYGGLKDDVKQFIHEAALKKKCSIIQMETDKDHIHMLLDYSPSQAISELVAFMKQYSTYKMWDRHATALSKKYWKKKILWSDGYFACSIGQASQTVVEKYIKNQG